MTDTEVANDTVLHPQHLSLHYYTVSITSGYEADIMYSHPMFMYDRKRTYQAMEAFAGMSHVDSTVMCHPAASYYTHLQPAATALKYPCKIDPSAYYPSYQPTEDPADRYQANITVSVQSQIPTSFGSSSQAAIGYSGYAAYSTTPHTVFGSASSTDTSSFTARANQLTSVMPHGATASAPVNAMSPVRSATVDEAPTPLTPPMSVSPVPTMTASPQSMASSLPPSAAYLERDNTISYRSTSASPPCVQTGDCDSTTTNDILDHKLPLHVLSDLSEGLPLPGM